MLTSVPATISSVPATIPSLLASRRPGHSLPAGLYTEQDVFDADMKVFFGRHWILVGLACEIPEPGDALTLDIGRASVILVRDDDMSVRAFHNVCRHRGARILDAGQTIVSRLVCPYHQWAHETSGQSSGALRLNDSARDRGCRPYRAALNA